jgi:hypothetical protein
LASREDPGSNSDDEAAQLSVVSDVSVRVRQLQLALAARKKKRTTSARRDDESSSVADASDDRALLRLSAESTPIKRRRHRFVQEQRAHFAAVDDVELQVELVVPDSTPTQAATATREDATGAHAQSQSQSLDPTELEKRPGTESAPKDKQQRNDDAREGENAPVRNREGEGEGGVGLFLNKPRKSAFKTYARSANRTLLSES